MIKDNLKNASKYYNLSPQIEMALRFLTDNDLNARKECLEHLKNLNADDEF
jgi:beta-galactosidase beta subunit